MNRAQTSALPATESPDHPAYRPITAANLLLAAKEAFVAHCGEREAELEFTLLTAATTLTHLQQLSAEAAIGFVSVVFASNLAEAPDSALTETSHGVLTKAVAALRAAWAAQRAKEKNGAS